MPILPNTLMILKSDNGLMTSPLLYINPRIKRINPLFITFHNKLFLLPVDKDASIEYTLDIPDTNMNNGKIKS